MIDKEKEEKILNDVLSGKRYKRILEENEVTERELYGFLDWYCKENNCKILPRYGKRVIEKNKEENNIEHSRKDYNKVLERILEIKTWCDNNKRFPKIKAEDSTEKEYAFQYRYIRAHLWELRRVLKPEETKNEIINQIIQVMDYLEENYNKSNIYETYKQVKELEQWCNENNRRPRKLHGFKGAKKADIGTDNESKEQKELRMYYILENAIIGCSTRDLSQIKNTYSRDAYYVIQQICKKYKYIDKSITGVQNEEIVARANVLQKNGLLNTEIEDIMKKYYGIQIRIKNKDNSKQEKNDNGFEL